MCDSRQVIKAINTATPASVLIRSGLWKIHVALGCDRAGLDIIMVYLPRGNADDWFSQNQRMSRVSIEYACLTRLPDGVAKALLGLKLRTLEKDIESCFEA